MFSGFFARRLFAYTTCSVFTFFFSTALATPLVFMAYTSAASELNHRPIAVVSPTANITIGIDAQSTNNGVIKRMLTIKNSSAQGLGDVYYALALYSPQKTSSATMDGQQVTRLKRDLISYSESSKAVFLQGEVDHTSSTTENPHVQFNSQNSSTVTLQASDDAGSCSASATITSHPPLPHFREIQP